MASPVECSGFPDRAFAGPGLKRLEPRRWRASRRHPVKGGQQIPAGNRLTGFTTATGGREAMVPLESLVGLYDNNHSSD